MTRPKQHVAQQALQQENQHDLIAQKAYEIYEQNGRVEGRDFDHWLEAERLIRTTRSTQG